MRFDPKDPSTGLGLRRQRRRNRFDEGFLVSPVGEVRRDDLFRRPSEQVGEGLSDDESQVVRKEFFFEFLCHLGSIAPVFGHLPIAHRGNEPGKQLEGFSG